MRSIETDELTASIHVDTERQSIVEAAADWFLRARDRQLTLGEERALAQWFRQSPRHIAEFIRMYQLHGLLREAKLHSFEPGPGPVALARWADRPSARARRWVLWSCGVALALICLLLLLITRLAAA